MSAGGGPDGGTGAAGEGRATAAQGLIERLAETVAGTRAPLEDTDRAELAELLPLIQQQAEAQGLTLGEDRTLAVSVHALAFLRRVREGEHLDALSAELYSEVPPERLAAVRKLIDGYCTPRGYAAPDSEVLLLALHFEVARHNAARAGRNRAGRNQAGQNRAGQA